MKSKGKFWLAVLPVVTKITSTADQIRGRKCKRVQELK